jgi:hypothetical protein
MGSGVGSRCGSRSNMDGSIGAEYEPWEYLICLLDDPDPDGVIERLIAEQGWELVSQEPFDAGRQQVKFRRIARPAGGGKAKGR